jgi:hypothetical protein
MSGPAERGQAKTVVSEAEPHPLTPSWPFEAQLHCLSVHNMRVRARLTPCV